MTGEVVEKRAQTWLVIQYRIHHSHPWQDLTRRDVEDEHTAGDAGREMAAALESLKAQGGPNDWRLIQRDRIEITTEEVVDE